MRNKEIKFRTIQGEINMNSYDKRFWIITSLSILIVALIAYIDIGGFVLVGEEYTLGNYNPLYWPHFLYMVYFIIAIIPLVYYLFTKDKSESFALAAVSFGLWRFGASDILYFVLQGKSIPDSLPWLFNNFPIGSIAKVLGLTTVTPFSLILSVAIGVVILLTFNKVLKDKF